MGGNFSKGKTGEESKSSRSNSSSSSLSNSEQGSISLSSSSIGPNYMNTMNPGSARVVASVLSLKEMSKLARTSKANQQIFRPLIEEAKEVLPVLRAVVQGDVEKLKQLVVSNSFLLFKKGQVTDPNGTTFYQVSPYLLMKFLADADMLNRMKPFLEPYGKVRREQDAEIDSGGADLIKMGKDPTTLAFEGVLRFKIIYLDRLDPLVRTEVKFPLLENKDGIIFYNNQFYYANKREQRVVRLNSEVHSEAEFKALEKLKASLNDMVDNSSRRSSNDEHAFITNTMHRTLKRKGVLFEHHSIRFRDSRVDFNRLTNAYRKCSKLYLERKWVEGDNQWIDGIGGAQRYVMWLLQRYCEEDRAFFRFPDFNVPPFKRSFNFFNYISSRQEIVFNDNHLHDGLGSNFAIFKGQGRCAGATLGVRWKGVTEAWEWDLIATSRLIEEAKVKVVELSAKQDLEHTNINGSFSI